MYKELIPGLSKRSALVGEHINRTNVSPQVTPATRSQSHLGGARSRSPASALCFFFAAIGELKLEQLLPVGELASVEFRFGNYECNGLLKCSQSENLGEALQNFLNCNVI